MYIKHGRHAQTQEFKEWELSVKSDMLAICYAKSKHTRQGSLEDNDRDNYRPQEDDFFIDIILKTYGLLDMKESHDLSSTLRARK